MKIYFKILLIISLSFILFSCKKTSDDKLIMVTEAGFAPYEYNSGGEIIGVDIDIAREIAKHIGKELVVRDVAFDSLVNELNSGKADFAAAGMSVSEERKKEVDFSIEYTTSKQVIVVRKGYDKIKKLDDLKDKTISVQLGSVADSYVVKEYPKAKLVTQKKFLGAAEDVKTGKSDCIIMDALPAKEMVNANKDLVILDIDVFTDKYAIAVKKGNKEMLDSINEVLINLINEGRIEEFIINHSS
ncbi:MAG: amino acid ABC transporter substrate-binding protein [Tenericutes bacterium]|nr:amino acid ABC transporter substrate-binding protein [Mycoplasmatota bacterium]